MTVIIHRSLPLVLLFAISGLPGEPYQIPSSTNNAGGTFSSTDAYTLAASTAQQSGIGRTTSSNYEVAVGFWYAIEILDCNGNSVDDPTDIDSGSSNDCNDNGIPDECDIAGGDSSDCDSDGIPNECDPCVADQDCDGAVGPIDLAMLLGSWGDCPEPPEPCPADIQGGGDGIVGAGDLAVLLAAWGPCP